MMTKSAFFASLVPLWCVLVLLLLAPQFFSAVRLAPPSMLGLPLGFVMLGVAAILTVLGLLAIRASESGGRPRG